MSNGIQGPVTFSRHIVSQIKAKGFTTEQVMSAIRNPDRVTEVRRYPGQMRYCGAGVAVVMDANHAITVYLDGTPTPLREDQLSDPEALASKRAIR